MVAGNSIIPLDKSVCQRYYTRIQTTDLFFTTQRSWSYPSAATYVAQLFREAPHAKTAVRGKLAVVTGVTTGGAGYYMAEELAVSAEMAVILLGRSTSKLQQAADAIAATAAAKRNKAGSTQQPPPPPPKLFIVPYDLNSLKSAQQAAAKVAEIAKSDDDDNHNNNNFKGQLHVLINNAGGMVQHYSTTDEGVEVLTGRNFLTPHHLTNQLLPLLRAAATPSYRPRIVQVASLGHCKGLDFDPNQLALHPTLGGAPENSNLLLSKTKNQVEDDYTNGVMGAVQQYYRAKLALIADAIALAKQEPSLSVVSLHPGSILSNFGNEMGILGTIYYYGFYCFQLGPSQGARAALRAALDPDFDTDDATLRRAGSYLHADGNPWIPCDPTTIDPTTKEPYTMEAFATRVKQVADELCSKLLLASTTK